MFDSYIDRWNLIPDGKPFRSMSSHLLPVRYRGLAAMLKIAVEHEERFGAALLAWWNGEGAARVYEIDGDALLMERAEGTRSLRQLSLDGQDDEACRIVCATVARLHAPRPASPLALIPLQEWFGSLAPAADAHGGIFRDAADAAQALLASQTDVVPLHGDIHHDNLLDFGERGWLAIDPKRLLGERGYDYANLFLNPEESIAASPGRFARRLDIVAETAGLQRLRQAQWVLAYAGLSAAWSLEGEDEPDTALAMAEIAAAEVARTGG